ncbi:MAG: hypothetical protein JO246_04815 [Frankiaceae bacterium]|nr:hypothetical protein [Frankiaceae bacterium]MBV9869509.1 hypothetical protein [Frankiaceae bacterium]
MLLPVAGLIRVASVIALFSLGGQTPADVPTLVHHPAHPASGAVGNDVGYQSCSTTLPTGGSFGVVGATAGQPFQASGCLSAEYTWASNLTYRPQYYMNLANPGHKSTHWGKGGPRKCHKKPKYDVGCAFDYGFTSAAAAWHYVKDVGSTGAGRWWLDVEPDNSWGFTRGGVAANLAVIRGALRYVRHRPHTSAGIYTETVWWESITGGSTHFKKVPVWGGGANNKKHAKANCKRHSITGGPALLAQWIKAGVDHDIAC